MGSSSSPSRDTVSSSRSTVASPDTGSRSNPSTASSPATAPSRTGCSRPEPQAPLAEWWQRLVARIIDGVIFGIVSGVLGLITAAVLLSSYNSVTGTSSGLLGPFAYGMVQTILMTALYVAYEYFMTKMSGQTVGKLVMGIKIVPMGNMLPPGGLPNEVALKRAAITWGGYMPASFQSSGRCSAG